MGFSSYQISGGVHDGEWGGYGHETVCDTEGCEAKIDRGLSYLCGMTPGGSEDSCGGYFCSEHLLLGPRGDGSRCESCTAEFFEDCADCDGTYAAGLTCATCDGNGMIRKASDE